MACSEGNIVLVTRADQREQQEEGPSLLMLGREQHQSQSEQHSQQELLQQALPRARIQHQHLSQLDQRIHSLQSDYPSPRNQGQHLNPLWLGGDETGEAQVQQIRVLFGAKELIHDGSFTVGVAGSSLLSYAPAASLVSGAAVADTATSRVTSYGCHDRKVAPAAGALQRWKSAQAVWVGQRATVQPHVSSAPVTTRQAAPAAGVRATSLVSANSYTGPLGSSLPVSAGTASNLVFPVTTSLEKCRSVPRTSAWRFAGEPPFLEGNMDYTSQVSNVRGKASAVSAERSAEAYGGKGSGSSGRLEHRGSIATGGLLPALSGLDRAGWGLQGAGDARRSLVQISTPTPPLE